MKKLLKHLFIVAVSLMWISCSACSSKTGEGTANDESANTTEYTLSPLSVDGLNLVNNKGEKVVLHGVSYGWHVFWPRFYNAKSVATLKEWGVDVVRAALGVEPDGGYIDEPEWSAGLIYDVVDAAIANDLYVIVDWHSHSINLTEAKAYFAEVATRYKGVPNVIYEIFNEPDYESWVEVKSYSKLVIKTIRDIDPDALILVGSPSWDQDVHLAKPLYTYLIHRLRS